MTSALSSVVGGDVAAFELLDRDSCIEAWSEQFGRKPPKYVSVQFMRRALAYELQVKTHGGHSPAIRRALERSLKDVRKPRSALPASSVALRPGTHLVREWNGRSYQVEVLEAGFRMDGKQYRSLSSIARKITGAHWSGPRFFGLDTL
ncbi:DUF2924 domain-containing protein [Oricola sp.]|uniref:DUF2924 domain-containing protein n=1 Tax=Oricola sp. TaxID=1979950 RepID=UPI00351108F5